MNDDDVPAPPRPTRTKAPNYPERRNLAKLPTGEWHIEDVVHELKARRRQRWPKLIAQVFAALSALGVGSGAMWKAFSAHDTAQGSKSSGELTEYRLTAEEAARKQLAVDTAAELERLERDHVNSTEKTREKLERLQLKQASCCARKDHE